MTKSPVLLSEIIKSKPVPTEVQQKVVSFSQFSTYSQCQYQWYLRYVQKIKPFSSTINTVFGTAMHEVLQEYLRVMYSISIKKADEIDLESMLQERLSETYLKEKESNNGEDFSSQEEMIEFYEDGIAILKWFKAHRAAFFTTKGYTLLGIEIPIMQPTDANPKVYITCFLDWVIYDEEDKTILIFDGKTSRNGWKDNKEKKDKVKIAQGLFYKRYFSKQYEVPEEDITIAFFIMRRKVWEQADWPTPRISVFRPACGVSKVKEANNMLAQFINEAFTPEGKYNVSREWPKNPGDSCKYCPFNSNLELCDMKRS